MTLSRLAIRDVLWLMNLVPLAFGIWSDSLFDTLSPLWIDRKAVLRGAKYSHPPGIPRLRFGLVGATAVRGPARQAGLTVTRDACPTITRRQADTRRVRRCRRR